MTDLTDRKLVEKTLRGDGLAFAELVGRYQKLIWRTIRRRLVDHFECEDAMQEILLRAFTSLHKFDTDRPFDHWIMRITTNYCIDRLRHRRSGRSWQCMRPLDAYRFAAPSHEDPQPYPADRSRVALRLLSELKPLSRNAFVLRELNGCDYEDIAKTLQISPLAARVRVSRARKQMHHKLRIMNRRQALMLPPRMARVGAAGMVN